jgi:hypothetical protein
MVEMMIDRGKSRVFLRKTSPAFNKKRGEAVAVLVMLITLILTMRMKKRRW